MIAKTIQDTKISSRDKGMAYFNSRKLAVEMLSGDKITRTKLQALTLELYNDWVGWYNEVEGRSEIRKCPKCGTGEVEMKFRKSDKNPFWGCSNYPDCKYTKDIQTTKKVEDNTHLPAEQRVIKTGDMPEFTTPEYK